MLPLTALSRRALVAAGLLAAAPAAAAKKKKRKPKPKPPLVLAWVTLTNVAVDVSGPEPAFTWAFQADYLHPASGESGQTSGPGLAAPPPTARATRAVIAARARDSVRSSLGLSGVEVPLDRIAVILL